MRKAGVPVHLLNLLADQVEFEPRVARAARRVIDTYKQVESLNENVDQLQNAGMVQGTKWQKKMLAHYRPMRLRARRAHKAALARLDNALAVPA